MELVYDGKKSIEEIKNSSYKLAKENKSIEINGKGILLKGDNFKAMSSLLKNYKEKIDLVYIDPPFNTNNKFMYDNERTSTISNKKDSIVAYDDNLPFEEYIEFIRERIILIYELLSNKGTLYFHIDTKIGHYIKIILDEIFGKDNFINDITRIKSNPKNFGRKAYGNEKDMILVYSKKPKNNIWHEIKIPLELEEIDKKFPKKDQDGRRYNTIPLHAPGETKNGVTGQPWRNMLPPEGRHWRTDPAEFEIMDEEGKIEWSSKGNPRIKKYADEHKGKKIQDVWKNYKDPQYPIYPTEKNFEMLDMIVKQSSNENSIIMDCFCGSGSFIEAGLKNNRIVIGIDKSDSSFTSMEKREELRNVDKIKI